MTVDLPCCREVLLGTVFKGTWWQTVKAFAKRSSNFIELTQCINNVEAFVSWSGMRRQFSLSGGSNSVAASHHRYRLLQLLVHDVMWTLKIEYQTYVRSVETGLQMYVRRTQRTQFLENEKSNDYIIINEELLFISYLQRTVSTALTIDIYIRMSLQFTCCSLFWIFTHLCKKLQRV